MAKIRRIIRKLKPPQYRPIDEQLWPVIVALVVLGGFTLGSLLAYLRFDDPRWYANALTWLVVAALLFGGAAVALTLVDNRLPPQHAIGDPVGLAAACRAAGRVAGTEHLWAVYAPFLARKT